MNFSGSSHHVAVETNPSIREKLSSIPGLARWVKDPALWCRSQMQLGSRVAVAVVQAGSCSSHWTPRLGASIGCRCGLKKTKMNKRKKET